jgi:1-deoxy-D-xylulose 5-phosphate reductoisomerase
MRLSRKEQLVILGSTGNVGSTAIEIIEKNLDRFAVHTLVCHSNKDKIRGEYCFCGLQLNRTP